MKKIQLYFSIAILFILYSLTIFADKVAPYDPIEQNPMAGYASPHKVKIDKDGLYIFAQKYVTNQETYKKESITTNKKYYLQFFKKNIKGEFKLFSLKKEVGDNTHIYLFGADQLGRDLLSRIIHGAKPSLTIGFLGLIIIFPIGVLYGAISAYSGPIIDNIMMRIAEAIMSFPSFYLLIILASLLPASLSNSERFALITFILSFTSWAGLSRVIRGMLLSVKTENYVISSELIGDKSLNIINKHLIPQTFSYLIVAGTLAVPGFIIGESALSFLGFGINQPDPSWGNILSEAKELSNIITKPILLILPSSLIFLSVYSYNVIGDYLRDKFDPRNKL
ncbi:MAG: ABC transporter permease [Candidatus Caenarcaniphilales bacterium]|nr:ABC transporter permease [Candidatus Caenarcaniphilales bacterium]